MNFRDQWATRSDGTQFVFTVEMQRRLSDHGLPIEPAALAQLPAAVAAPARSHQPAQERPSRESAPREERPAPAAVAADFQEPDSIQIDPSTGKYIGRVKWFNEVKGFGFIARGGGEELFFHKTSVLCNPADLTDGAWILYDVEQGQKGLEASEIEVYEGDV
ncbi:MAG: cold shock domain-containing protein [Chloroflexi bacterium]|nr:cold shock domain-containing protein [Chloroflexota bacterium]